MTDRITKIILRGDISGLKASMQAAGASVADVTKRITDNSKESAKWRQGLTSVGSTAGKVGLVAAAGLGAIVIATANFDKSMSAVQAATHESAGAMEDLRAAAIKAGADTAFSATEAASGIEELAKAGVDTKDILGGGLTGALDLAAAGAMGVGDAAEIAATAMTQFALDGSKVPHVADLLAAGAGKAQGSVADMGMALKQSGLVAAQTGLTIEETTGTLAAFASAGLIGSDAGTSFKTMLQSLTPTGDKARETMDKLGITAYDAQGNFVGMTTFADSLKDGLKNLSVEQQNAAMKTIFGSDAVRAASVIFKQGGTGVQSWIDKVNDSGFAAETAKTRLDNLSGDLEAFKGSLETALIGSGEGAQGPLRDLVQGATGAVNAFNKLPGPLKATGTAMLGITAVLGGGLWFTAKTLTGVATMRTSMATLGVTASGTAAALRRAAVSAGLIGAAFVAIDTGSGIIDSFKRSHDAASGAADSFEELRSKLEKSNVGKYADSFGVDINRLAEDIGTFGTKGDYYAQVVGKMNSANDGFGGKAKQLTDFIGPWIGSTEKAGLATMDLRNITDKAAKGLFDTAKSVDGAKKSLEDLSPAAQEAAAKTAELDAATAAAKDSTIKAATAFMDFGANLDPKKMGFDDYLKSLEEMAKAQENWADNLIKATARGVDEGVIDKFKEMGPEGAKRLAELADASDAEIARVNKAFRSAADSGTNLADVLDGLPASVLTEFKTPGANDAISTAIDVANRYFDTPDQVETVLQALDYTKPQIKAVLAAFNKVDDAHPTATLDADTSGAIAKLRALQTVINDMHGKTVGIHVQGGAGVVGGGTQLKATGGAISGPGTGTSDSILMWGSNGEHMWTADEVEKAGGQDAMYRMRALAKAGALPRFKDGGYVGAGIAAAEHYANGGEVRAGGVPSAGLLAELRAESHQSAKDMQEYTKALKKSLSDAKTGLGDFTSKLSEARDAMKSYAEEVGGKFKNDPFNQGNLATADTPFYSGLAGFGATVSKDTQDAKAMTRALKTLTGKGLDGALFKDLAGSGDLLMAQDLATQSKATVDYYEKAYRGREVAANRLGAYAGNVSFGPEIKAFSGEVAALKKVVAGLSKQLEAATYKGTRDGVATIGKAAGSSQHASKNTPRR